VSLHCELADILNAYTRIVQSNPSLRGLAAYSAARPPHAEGLAVWIAAYLANEAACPNVNLLHLSSRKAMEAAMVMQRVFPHIDFRREVTVGHLLLDTSAPTGALAKVNPPIRPREDVEHLWRAVLEGEVSWIVSDHACCSTEMKVSSEHPDDIWFAGRLRRHRVPALRRVQRGQQARAAPSPHGRALLAEPGAALWAAQQGRRGAGL